MKHEKPPPATRQPSRFNIEVTEKDIAKAKRGDSYICVVSQAIARAIPDATRIETDNQTIRFTRGAQRYVFLTPYSVAGYVVAFDAGDVIKPFSFQLRNPARVSKKRLTDVGRKINRAQIAARHRATRRAKAAGLSLDKPEVVSEIREAATAAYDEAARANPGKRSTQGGRPAPPRVFKRKSRSYGHRLLRINQARPE